jgi:hypothetical protein
MRAQNGHNRSAVFTLPAAPNQARCMCQRSD